MHQQRQNCDAQFDGSTSFDATTRAQHHHQQHSSHDAAGRSCQIVNVEPLQAAQIRAQYTCRKRDSDAEAQQQQYLDKQDAVGTGYMEQARKNSRKCNGQNAYQAGNDYADDHRRHQRAVQVIALVASMAACHVALQSDADTDIKEAVIIQYRSDQDPHSVVKVAQRANQDRGEQKRQNAAHEHSNIVGEDATNHEISRYPLVDYWLEDLRW